MPKAVYIHAGAHRTGTSSFQMCLDLNRGALATAGYDTAYPGRDGIPGGNLRLKLKDAGAAARVLAGHSTSPDRALIVSEENIPGRMFPFYRGRFYPAAESRLRVLRSALATLGVDRPRRMVLVLRSYDALFTSAYRKRAEDNAVAPFHEVSANFMAMDRGWPALVRAFQKIIDPQRFVVISYTKRGRSVDLLNQLVPDLSMPLREPERALNLSATDAALEALQARYRAGETLTRAQWQAVIADHADAQAPTGFASLQDGDIALLRARYEQHLDKISQFRGITFLR